MSRREERLDDPEEALRQAMEGQLAGTWTALPGVITAVDLEAQTCTVQPAIQGMVEDEAGAVKPTNLPVLIHVPLVWPRAGGFALTLPVAPGDECLVVFSCRAMDSWWQSGGTANVPVEGRMHDLSDGFAILAPTSQAKKLANVSDENVQVRDEAGTTFVEITPDGKVRLVAVSKIEMEAPDIELTGAVKINGATTMDGALTQSGGEATLTDEVIHVSTHTHVETGTETELPTPGS